WFGRFCHFLGCFQRGPTSSDTSRVMVLPPARTRASLLERLLRPVSSVLFAFVAAAPALVHAASDPAPAEPEDDRPPEERFTAPVSADCDHRMPLWEHVVAEGEHLGLIAGRYGV